LPDNVRNCLLPSSEACDRDRAFRVALARHPPGDYVVFADCDVYLAHRDIRANVMMAARHDYVSGYEYLYDLTPDDCERILAAGGRIDFPGYSVRERPPGSGFCVFKGEALMRLGGWPGGGLRESLLAGLQVFKSPNPAMRLFHQETAPCKP
jgi:hypothetical protein